MTEHKTITTTNSHAVPRKVWADSSARAADAGPYTADEKYIFGLQLDTDQVYYLEDHTGPTWTAIAGGGGGNTLDQAYDQGGAGAGRTITVDSGAVTLTANSVDATSALSITRSPGSSAAAVGMSITMGSNATGPAIDVPVFHANTLLRARRGTSSSGALFAEVAMGAYTTAEDYQAIRFYQRNEQNGPDYITEIRAVTTATNPSFLDPRLDFVIQDEGTNAPGSISRRFTVLNNGAGVMSGDRFYLDGPLTESTGDTYLTESSANNIKVFTGGSEALLLDSSQDATFAGAVKTANGSGGAAAVGPSGDPDTGLVWATGAAYIYTAGILRAAFSASGINSNVAGSNTNPSVKMAGDQLGMYRVANDHGGLCANGDAIEWDNDSTAGNTRLLVYDQDSGAVGRVKVGSNGTGPGGTGRALYMDDV